MNTEEVIRKNKLKTIHNLKKKWVKYSTSGELKQFSTQEIKGLIEDMHVAADVLLIFPECGAIRTWLLTEASRLNSVVFHREHRW